MVENPENIGDRANQLIQTVDFASDSRGPQKIKTLTNIPKMPSTLIHEVAKYCWSHDFLSKSRHRSPFFFFMLEY